MSNNPTPTQALLLFGLLARHGECAQAELMPAVTKADREALEKAKLIAVTKIGRAFAFTLSDAGWEWAGAHLSAELPPAHGALHDMLERLGEHLAREKETLGGFIGAKPEKKVAIKPEPVRKKAKATSGNEPADLEKAKRPKTPAELGTAKTTTKRATKPAEQKVPKPRPPSAAALRKRIEAAYLTLTGGRKNESVRLAHLRGAMPDLDRTTVDAALGRILKGDTKASLMRHDDPGQLNSADHAAAFNPAGEPFHVIWIAS